jgi:hypothetical protein
MTCPDGEETETLDESRTYTILTHILVDVHELCKEIHDIKIIVDEFAPLARQARSRFLLRNMGRK